MEGAKRRFLVNSNCQQLDSNYHKNILVEEREFVRIERKLKKIGPQADEVGEQQLPAIGQQLKEIGPQADGGCDE